MKVLIVEDAKTVSLLLQVYLMGWDLEFVTAADGAEGLDLARQVQPHLIISDVNMPKMDGFELCAAVRSDSVLHATPIVLLTANHDNVARQKGKLVGATAFLGKPITPQELRQKVSEILHLPLKG